MSYENMFYWVALVVTAISIMVLFYAIPYLIRRGWLQGENDTAKSRRVCDICFRDLNKLKKAMSESVSRVDNES